MQLLSQVPACKGRSCFLAGRGAEPSSGIALDFLMAVVLQLRFCSANHKVILALGAKSHVLTSFRTEENRLETTVRLVCRRGNQSCHIQLITVVTCSPGAEPRCKRARDKAGGERSPGWLLQCCLEQAPCTPRMEPPLPWAGEHPQSGASFVTWKLCFDSRAAICPASQVPSFLSAALTEESLPSWGFQPCSHPGHRVLGRTFCEHLPKPGAAQG